MFGEVMQPNRLGVLDQETQDAVTLGVRADGGDVLVGDPVGDEADEPSAVRADSWVSMISSTRPRSSWSRASRRTRDNPENSSAPSSQLPCPAREPSATGPRYSGKLSAR